VAAGCEADRGGRSDSGGAARPLHEAAVPSIPQAPLIPGLQAQYPEISGLQCDQEDLQHGGGGEVGAQRDGQGCDGQIDSEAVKGYEGGKGRGSVVLEVLDGQHGKVASSDGVEGGPGLQAPKGGLLSQLPDGFHDSDGDEGGSGMMSQSGLMLWKLSQAPTPSADATGGRVCSEGSCSDHTDDPSPTHAHSSEKPAATNHHASAVGDTNTGATRGFQPAHCSVDKACASNSVVYPPSSCASLPRNPPASFLPAYPPATSSLHQAAPVHTPLLYPLESPAPAAPPAPSAHIPPARTTRPAAPAAPKLLPHLAAAAAAAAAAPAAAPDQSGQKEGQGGSRKEGLSQAGRGKGCERGHRRREVALFGRLGQWMSDKGRRWGPRSPRASGMAPSALSQEGLVVVGGFVFSSETQGEMVTMQKPGGGNPVLIGANMGESATAGHRRGGIRMDAFWQ